MISINIAFSRQETLVSQLRFVLSWFLASPFTPESLLNHSISRHPTKRTNINIFLKKTQIEFSPNTDSQENKAQRN